MVFFAPLAAPQRILFNLLPLSTYLDVRWSRSRSPYCCPSASVCPAHKSRTRCAIPLFPSSFFFFFPRSTRYHIQFGVPSISFPPPAMFLRFTVSISQCSRPPPHSTFSGQLPPTKYCSTSTSPKKVVLTTEMCRIVGAGAHFPQFVSQYDQIYARQ